LRWEAKRSIREALGRTEKVIQCINNSETSDLFLGTQVGSPALVPGSLIRLFDEVVTVESGVRDEGDLLGLESNQLEHLDKFFLNLVETILGPAASVHLVDAHNDLLHTKQVKETCVLSGLTFFNSQLWVSLGNRRFESALLSGHKKKTNVSGGRSSDHVLDVILVSRGIDNSVVVLVRVELLGVALDCHSTVAFFLGCIKVVSVTKRSLSVLFRSRLELLHLAFRNTSLLED
jgi:hypothetical protein